MDFKQAVTAVLNKYCCFKGRAGRAEFWYFALFQFIIMAVLSGLSAILGSHGGGFIAMIQGLIGLALLLPGLGVAVRRMHDLGKGGGWIFINLVPLVGAIWYIVLAATAGEPTANRFGEPA
ncbi:MAG: DUF805 domain-containing protein [Muribaculaceae bacterium]|nr:DUF805 domain-containing protein [Muribaculaceae bacterium]